MKHEVEAPLEAENRLAPGGYWDQRIRIIFLETVANILAQSPRQA
jgi:hypothetical protein